MPKIFAAKEKEKGILTNARILIMNRKGKWRHVSIFTEREIIDIKGGLSVFKSLTYRGINALVSNQIRLLTGKNIYQ